MPNLISFQLPVTHTGTYHVSFSPQTLDLLTVKITTVLPIQYKDQEVQVNSILLDIKQESEMLKLSKFLKSSDHDKEIVPTSDHDEKPLCSPFSMHAKAILKDGPDIDNSITEPESEDEWIGTALVNGDGLLSFHNSSLPSQCSTLSQESVSTFILMRHAQALYGGPPPGVLMQLENTHKHSPFPSPFTLRVKCFKFKEE
ncbi:hypothetical protein J3A83DRAFT_4368769 [Scleroderma citrinum]